MTKRQEKGALRLTQLIKMNVIGKSTIDGKSLASLPIFSEAVMNFPLLNGI